MSTITSRVSAALAASAAVAAVSVLGVGGAHAAPNAVSAQDKAFMAANAQTSLAEITLAGINAQRSQDPATQELGRMTTTDHTAALTKLKAVAATAKVTLPSAPNTMQQTTAATLKSTPQSKFDIALDTAEVTGHRMSIADTNKEIAEGSDPATVAYAKYYLPVATKHLNMAVAALQGLGGPVPGGVPAGSGGQRAAANTASGGLDGILFAGAGVLLIAAAGLTIRARQRS